MFVVGYAAFMHDTPQRLLLQRSRHSRRPVCREGVSYTSPNTGIGNNRPSIKSRWASIDSGDMCAGIVFLLPVRTRRRNFTNSQRVARKSVRNTDARSHSPSHRKNHRVFSMLWCFLYQCEHWYRKQYLWSVRVRKFKDVGARTPLLSYPKPSGNLGTPSTWRGRSLRSWSQRSHRRRPWPRAP